jgi:hypothetical protein
MSYVKILPISPRRVAAEGACSGRDPKLPSAFFLRSPKVHAPPRTSAHRADFLVLDGKETPLPGDTLEHFDASIGEAQTGSRD